ncbi:MAG: hypothetical protein ACT4OP_10935 [Actinomycetota bacterium]
MNAVEVRRSALKMWLIAMGGIPPLVLGVDILFRRRIIGFFQNLIWPNGNPELLEPRDYIWAVALIVLGLMLAVYGLKDLISPRPLVAGDAQGLHLRLGGPISRPLTVSWADISDLGAEEVDDDGEAVPVFWVRLRRTEVLPPDLWGARWLDGRTLAILASDWERPPARVAEDLAAIAIEATVRPPAAQPSPDERPLDILERESL